MGGRAVSKSWFGSLRLSWNRVVDRAVEAEKPLVGIMAFEVAGLMLKMVNLWNIVNENEMLRLREDIVNSVGVRRLVSADDEYLMELALNEIIENLGYLALAVVRLGKRCTDPVYHRFEQFFDDPLEIGFQWVGWEYRLKKMERKIQKMERFIGATMQLSQELEVLVEFEQTLRRMRDHPQSNRATLLEFRQKVLCKRQEVKNLQDMSPWSRTYDYIVRLLARSLFTLLERIKEVFGCDQKSFRETNDDFSLINSDCLSRSHSFSVLMQSSVHPSDGRRVSSGPFVRSLSKPSIHASKNKTSKLRQAHNQLSIQHENDSQLKGKWTPHVGPFKGCMTGGIDSPVFQSCKPEDPRSMSLRSTQMKSFHNTKYTHTGSQSFSHSIYSKLSLFSSKCTLLAAPPSTLGDAALALHYANVILSIEKIAESPGLICFDARCNLYNMLTTSIRTTLRARLKSSPKTTNSSVYDPAFAGKWSLAMEQILEWLAPLAHNMRTWHSERNIVKQQEVSRSNVLLVQTLYFASRAKTETAIVELLTGLNYLCMVDELNRKALQDGGGRDGSGPYEDHMVKRVICRDQ